MTGSLGAVDLANLHRQILRQGQNDVVQLSFSDHPLAFLDTVKSKEHFFDMRGYQHVTSALSRAQAHLCRRLYLKWRVYATGG